VTFRYRTTDTGTLRSCTLLAEDFIRRFLQHVLPKGFVKVRYYGFFSQASSSGSPHYINSSTPFLLICRRPLKGTHYIFLGSAQVEEGGAAVLREGLLTGLALEELRRTLHSDSKTGWYPSW
jgi:hypothetical protein